MTEPPDPTKFTPHTPLSRNQWSSGLCRRGHDVTQPDAVGYNDKGRYCRACQKLRDRSKRQHFHVACVACGKPKTRSTHRFCSEACKIKLQEISSVDQGDHLSAAQVSSMMDLLLKAEDAMPWEKDRLKKQALAIDLLRKRSLARARTTDQSLASAPPLPS
jgi:hypothetical protein